MFAPLVVIVAIALCFGSAWSPFAANWDQGRFLWEIMLGLALGCIIALLPVFYDGGSREHYAAQRWFACVLLVAVIVYQYMTSFYGWSVPWLNWLKAANIRVLFAEGVLSGYCLVGALRARR